MTDDPRPCTILIDIDGTILFQRGGLDQQILQTSTLLPGVLEKFHEWDRLGYIIILMTGRKESMRRITERQLEELGVYFDQLVMGIGGGVRVLINNSKDSCPGLNTAVGITIPKNKGLEELSI